MSDCSTNAWKVPNGCFRCAHYPEDCDGKSGCAPSDGSLITLAPSDAKIIISGAVRYYLGRRTAAMYSFCRRLIELAPELDSATRDVLERDISDWLGDHLDYMMGPIDDAEPWRRVLDALRSVEP